MVRRADRALAGRSPLRGPGPDRDLSHGPPSAPLPRRVADPFHVTRAGNRTLDQVRRRVQNETLVHRGRKVDPLFRLRKLLLRGYERLEERGRAKMMAGLRFGEPRNELLGAWLAKGSVPSIYLTDDVDESAELLGNAIVAYRGDEVAEIRNLGHTLSRWRVEILNHHRAGARRTARPRG